jgi:hypothetical protein
MFELKPSDPWAVGGSLFQIWWDSLWGRNNDVPPTPPPPPPPPFKFTVTVTAKPAKYVGQVPAMALTAVAQAPATCLTVIGGSSTVSTDIGRLSKTARGMHWFDGRQPLPQFPRFLFDYSNGDATNAVPYPGARPTNNVILWSAFFHPANTYANQLSTLFHEITHPFLKLGDQGMLNHFNILNVPPPAGGRSTYQHPGSASEIYLEWLSDGCPQ